MVEDYLQIGCGWCDVGRLDEDWPGQESVVSGFVRFMDSNWNMLDVKVEIGIENLVTETTEYNSNLET